MDAPVDLSLFGTTKDHIVAFGRLNLVKDKNNNDKRKQENKEIKKSVLSRLPQNVRSISSFRNPKSNGKVNITSIPDNAAGTSHQLCSNLKSRTGSLGGEEKPKPSQIPRRKSAKELPTRESTIRTINKNKPNRPKPFIEPRNNVQRVQLLNVDPDFCPAPPNSVLITSARPIPKLGHVYRQDISSNSLTDWYLESVSEYNMNTSQDSTEPNATVNTAVRIESRWTTKLNENSSVNHNILEKRATVVISKGDADSLRTSTTFTIPKVHTDFIPLTISTIDVHKPLKYPSAPNPCRKPESIRIPVPSYVEYPSEVLQKTTNFETEAAYATSSSNAGPDQDYDNKPSQWTVGHVDENSASTDDTAWSQLQSSQDTNLLEPFKTSYFTEEMWREPYVDDKKETDQIKCPDQYNNHDSFNNYCWRKEVVNKDTDCKGSCKKYRKYINTPVRKKELKSRIWIGRNCKHRWNRVRKRTADRWAHWSRSTYGFRKVRMDDLKKSLIWDNANVQTTMLVYRETGTDAVAKEQKSAAITTSLNLNACASFFKNGSSSTSARSTKSPIRRVNIGPSMFPFLYYPSTDIKYTPPEMNKSITITKSIDDCFYYGVDRGTEMIPPLNKSQRSITVMTSNGIIQELAHKETQVSPEPSIKKFTTAVLAERYEHEDVKVNVVKDNSVPYRRYDNTRLVTKGAILSCTGTTVTSVSSSQIQPAAEISRMSRVNVVSTVIHPECSSVCINTDVELKSKSTGTGESYFDSRLENRKKSTNDCHVQCSDPLYNIETCDNSRYVARIGLSRLMSVCMLSDSVTEMATQAQPVLQCAETNTPFKQNMSASVFTSHYAIGEPLRSNVKVQPKDSEHILTCHCANTACSTKPIDAKERRSQAFAPVHNDVACNTNSETKSVSQLTTRNETVRQAASNAEPNFVISSNLNATKWMKGCTKDSDKDVQSIISISETMVTKPLDRASLLKATSKDRQSIGEIKKLSEVVINHQPAVGCVTTMGYHPSSSELGITRMLPTKDENSEQDKNTSSNRITVNKMTSGTGFDITPSEKQSASVLTSRHILPNLTRCEHSSKETPLKKHGRMSSRSVGQAVTPFKRRSSCSNPRSNGEILSPKVYKALYDTTKLIAKEGSESSTPKSSTTGKEKSETTVPKCSKTEKRGYETMTPDSFTQNISKITGNVNNRSIQTLTEPVLFCPYCNARLSQTHNLDRESMKSRSIQAAGASLLNCPQCSAKIAVLSNDSSHESAEECIQSYLAASCRYYSNLLTIKLAQVKDNFKKHIAPSIEGALYQAATIPNSIFHRTPSNNIIFTEACTMKPSGRRDETCEARFYTTKLNKHTLLYPALSLTDVRGHDKNDLKNVYYILTAIEGRVRRLKSNLTS